MSDSIDGSESSEDIWWSQEHRAKSPNRKGLINKVENKKSSNFESCNGSLSDESPNNVTTEESKTIVKPKKTLKDVTTNGEELAEIKKENKSDIKRPSGAQRRKRKWRRLETNMATAELHNIQTGFKKLNIDDLGDDRVVPSYSKKGAQYDSIPHIYNCEQKPVKGYYKKRYQQHNLKSDFPEFENVKPLAEYEPAGFQPKNEHFQNSVSKFSKRKCEDNSEQANVEQIENKRTAYSSALKNKLDAVIIDESNTEGILTSSQSDQIIDKLMTRLSEFTFTSNSDVPKFQGYFLNKGILTINCVNDNSMEWLMNAELNNLWDGAKIKIMRANEFAKHIRMTAFIPGPVRENVEILKLLKTQNCELNTSRWRIYHRNQGTSTGMTLVLGVDEKSLEVLRSLEMKPYYGMSRAAFYLPETKQISSSRK